MRNVILTVEASGELHPNSIWPKYQLPRVESLLMTAYHCSNSVLSIFVESMPNLHSLHLNGHSLSSFDSLFSRGDSLEKLEKLEIDVAFMIRRGKCAYLITFLKHRRNNLRPLGRLVCKGGVEGELRERFEGLVEVLQDEDSINVRV
jgi:hypothetical protein